MLMLAVCKLVTDLLLFYIVAGLFFSGTITVRLMILSILGCVLGYGLRKVHGVLLGFGLLGLTGMGTLNIWQIIFAVLPFAYTIYLSKKDDILEYFGDLSSRFLIYLIVAVCVTIVGQIYGHPAYDFILLFFYAVFGIFTLQMFRLYQGGGLTWRRTSFFVLLLIGLCGLILLAAAPVIWRAIGSMIQWIYLNMVVPLLEIFLQFLLFLLGLLFRFINWLAELLHFKAGTFITDVPAMLNAEAAQDFLIQDVTPGKSLFLTVVSVVVVLGLAFLLFRMLRGRRTPFSRSYVTSGVTSASPVKREKLPGGNIGEVRRRYRRMLVKMKKQGAKIEKTSTTEDVAMEGLAYYSVEENERIKEEYRKARYG